MKIIRFLLFPVVPIYYMVTWLRNKLYDSGIKKSRSYNFPVVCVGNLSVGGTGKTPLVEYLIKLLKADYKLATLSRGYGRQTKGFQLANSNTSAKLIGDEPFQFYNKFKNDILVAVDADRQHGIAILRDLKKRPEVILLDDAFQHRKVKAGLNILLTTFNNLYVKDMVLPTGNLREPKGGARRANIIVVTKCPQELSSSEKALIEKRINPKANQLVCFSTIVYSTDVLSENNKKLPLESLSKFTLVTGIANAKPLLDYLLKKNLDFEHLEYKDHHQFSQDDIKEMSSSKLILTTEKDYMRLKHVTLLKGKLYYLPIVCDIDKASEFNESVKSFVGNMSAGN